MRSLPRTLRFRQKPQELHMVVDYLSAKAQRSMPRQTLDDRRIISHTVSPANENGAAKMIDILCKYRHGK